MIYLFLILAVVLVWLYYRRSQPELPAWHRRLLGFLRLAAIVILLILLFNPVMYFQEELQRIPTVLLMQDVSSSMDEPLPSGTKAGLFEPAVEQLRQRWEGQGYRVREIPFADGIGDSLQPGRTLFIPALEHIAREEGLDEVVAVQLVSDGWLHDPNPVQAASMAGVPVHVILPEYDNPVFNLAVEHVHTNRTVFKGEIAPVLVDCSSAGYKGTARLTMRVQGRDVMAREIDFSGGEFQQVDFDYTFNRTGLQLLEFIITALDRDDEPDVTDNIQPAAVQVVDKQLTGVILAGTLDWDTRFLQRSFSGDGKWKITVYHQNNRRWFEDDQSSTLSEILVSEPRVVTLLTGEGLAVTDQEIELIRDYVASGGGFVLMGRPPDDFHGFFPVKISNVRLRFEGGIVLTEEADRFETMRIDPDQIASIPPLRYWYATPSPGGRVLARFTNEQNSPAVVYDTHGRGRMLGMPFRDLWRWQMWEGDRCSEFLTDVFDWLGSRSGDRFVVMTDRNAYSIGQTVVFELVAHDETMRFNPDLNPKLTVTDSLGNPVLEDYLTQDGETYRYTAHAPPAGTYEYTASDERTGQTATGQFLVHPYAAESGDRGINRTLLTALARQTGGRIQQPGHLDDFLPDEAVSSTLLIEHELPLYRRWYLIALFLTAFSIELFLRKRWGLL